MKKQSSNEPVNIPLLNIDRKLLENSSQAENNDNIKLPKNRQQAYTRWKSKKSRNDSVQPAERVCTGSIPTCTSIIQASSNSENIATPMDHNRGNSFYHSSKI